MHAITENQLNDIPHVDITKEDIDQPGKAFGRGVSTNLSTKCECVDTSQKTLKYWKALGDRKYSPTLDAVSHCGLLFRGDDRKPDEIFKTGFLSRVSNNKISTEKEFYDQLLKAQVTFRPANRLITKWKTAVCLSENAHVATHFPWSDDANSYTYVYCCYVHNGVKLFEKAQELKIDSENDIEMVVSGKEVITPEVPAEHVICAWKTERKNKQIPRCAVYEPVFETPEYNFTTDACVTNCLKNSVVPNLPTQPRLCVKLNEYGIVSFDNE